MESQRPLTDADLSEIPNDDIPEESEDMNFSDDANQSALSDFP